jgi:hypothetical protein
MSKFPNGCAVWLDDYLCQLREWGIRLDHEDGSTAPFTAECAQAVAELPQGSPTFHMEP